MVLTSCDIAEGDVTGVGNAERAAVEVITRLMLTSLTISISPNIPVCMFGGYSDDTCRREAHLQLEGVRIGLQKFLHLPKGPCVESCQKPCQKPQVNQTVPAMLVRIKPRLKLCDTHNSFPDHATDQD